VGSGEWVFKVGLGVNHTVKKGFIAILGAMRYNGKQIDK
jgi:hypothetical protein